MGRNLGPKSFLHWIILSGSMHQPDFVSRQTSYTHDRRGWRDVGLHCTGIHASEPGPGGNSPINRFHSKGPVDEFEGMMIMTWDPRGKSYRSYIFGNDFPGAIIETELAGLTSESLCPPLRRREYRMPQPTAPTRNALAKMISNDGNSMNVWAG